MLETLLRINKLLKRIGKRKLVCTPAIYTVDESEIERQLLFSWHWLLVYENVQCSDLKSYMICYDEDVDRQYKVSLLTLPKCMESL